MRIMRWVTAAAALTAMLLMAGCGGGETPSPAPSAPQPSAVDETAPATSPAQTAQTAAADEPILIGVAGPFTGPSAQFGYQINIAVQVAAREINERGGINGRRVEALQEDDEGNPSSASTVARRLAQNPDVVAVVGHFNSRCSLNGVEIYDEAGVVMLSPASTNSTICALSPWAFRNIFTDEFQGQTIARYLQDVLGLSTVGVLYENDDYGRGLFEHFKAEAERLGLNVVAEVAYDNTAGDFIPLVRRVVAENPDIIFMSGLYEHGARIAEAKREIGSDIPLIGSDGMFSEEYMTLAGEAADGTLITTPFLFELAGEGAQGFVDAYHEIQPDSEPDAWAALAYDAFHTVAWAIENAGADREAVRNFLQGIDSPETAYRGLTGATFFDENGDCRKPIQVALVEGGGFVPAPLQFD